MSRGIRRRKRKEQAVKKMPLTKTEKKKKKMNNSKWRLPLSRIKKGRRPASPKKKEKKSKSRSIQTSAKPGGAMGHVHARKAVFMNRDQEKPDGRGPSTEKVVGVSKEERGKNWNFRTTAQSRPEWD